MKFNIHSKILKQELLKHTKIVKVSKVVAILSYVLLTIKDNTLFITSSDLSKTLRVPIKLTSPALDGAICVNFDLFSKVVNQLEGDIAISLTESNTLLIKSGNKEINLNSLPAADFPSFPEASLSLFSVIGLSLKEAVNRVSFACSNGTSLAKNGLPLAPVLQGVNFKLNGEHVDLCATNSFYLAYKKLVVNPQPVQFAFTLHKESLLPVLPLLTIDAIQVTKTDSWVIFSNDNFTYGLRLLDGIYPDYTKLIPNYSVDRFIGVTVQKQNFKSLISSFCNIVLEKTVSTIILSKQDQQLKIFYKNPEFGAVQELIIYDKLDSFDDFPDDLQLEFNVRFMKEVLSNLQGEQINLLTKGANTPLLYKESLDNDYLILQAPFLKF